MSRIKALLLLVLLLALPLSVHAQTSTPTAFPTLTPPDPNANITWPPPVYLLRGQFEVRGAANLPNMSTHFLEYRPLDAAGNPPPDTFPWIPATLPSASAVLDDVLGIWDTTIVPDGLYELRLTINVTGATDPVHHEVRPLRIENNPPPFAVTPSPPPLPTIAASPALPTQPPLQATPTAFSAEPTAEVIVSSGNVRRGDSTAYEVVGTVRIGETLPVLARSSTGSGWWKVRLPNGREGWAAPSVIRVTGDTSRLPREFPPPPPPTPTPTPIPATATPVSQADLIIASITLDPAEPRCDQTFTIRVNVRNVGTTQSNSSGTIAVQDNHINTGTVTATTIGGFPSLAPGQTFEALIPLTVSTYYNEQHRISIQVDSLNQVVETNENNNFGSIEYNLRRAGC